MIVVNWMILMGILWLVWENGGAWLCGVLWCQTFGHKLYQSKPGVWECDTCTRYLDLQEPLRPSLIPGIKVRRGKR